MVGTPFCVFHPALSATPVVPVSVVPVRVVLAWYDRPWCGKRVVQRWYEVPLCGAPVVPRVIACSVWFCRTPVVLA